jgi:hypothetical protein
VMLVAIVTVHLGKGFFAQNGGYEYPLVLAVTALTLAFTGPGSLSIDAIVLDWPFGCRWARRRRLLPEPEEFERCGSRPRRPRLGRNPP